MIPYVPIPFTIGSVVIVIGQDFYAKELVDQSQFGFSVCLILPHRYQYRLRVMYSILIFGLPEDFVTSDLIKFGKISHGKGEINKQTISLTHQSKCRAPK
jgi:hypothetical protein